MTDNEWMTVSEASEKVNIPVETVRRYIRSHSVHLKVKKLGKKYSIHNDSLTVIKQIRVLYDHGKNVDEVEESLSASGIPMTFTVKNDNDEAMTVHVADELLEIKKVLQQQQEFNKALMTEVTSQSAEINELKNVISKERELFNQQFEQQKEFSKLLIDEHKEQGETIAKLFEILEQDQKLIESNREALESIVSDIQKQQADQEVATAEQQEEVKRGFFSRLFRK